MALTPGTRLGVYDITTQIGEGGMGQVYRAIDTKLKRQVAIKILPASLAADADRLARFQREAEVLASLNHPHIAAIYGLEGSGGMTALVMELVEGDDLSQRIARGAIPIDEALAIAKQIAEALEGAHEQGIIHRDLKPANIKVRPDGTVKVLDFGLAKAMEPATGSSPGLSMSPTITTPAMTQAGMILGTAAYMSPEQAKGRTVDRRSDVWAFGAVLFEMLTGKRAFGGDDISDTLANVLKVEPNWNGLPAEVSPRVRLALRACLQKDPKQRLGDVQSVRLALEGAFETAPPQTAAPATSSMPRGRLAWIAFAIAVLGMVALAIPALRYLRETPASLPPETRTEIGSPGGAASSTQDPASFALSPDGRQIVFLASGDGPSRLWLRSLATTASQPLPGTDGATYPFWSPDSRSVAFFADGKLKRLDLAGGRPQVLANAYPRGGSWNADGVLLYAATAGSPLFRVTASGGSPAPVTKLDRQVSHRFPSFLPDGQHFLFYALGTPNTGGIYLGSLDRPNTTRLTVADTAGLYLPSGWLAWVRAETLVAQRLDLTRSALIGDPVTVADPVAFNVGSHVGAFSVSGLGLIAYRSPVANRRQLMWFDRAGKTLGAFGVPDENGLQRPRVSPDGRQLVAERSMQGNADLWLLDGTRTTRFTFDPQLDRYGVWSPDGRQMVFDSNRSGPRNLYLTSIGRAGTEEVLLASAQDKSPTDWSADGRFLLYQGGDMQTGLDIWVLPMPGDRLSAGSGRAGAAEGHKPWALVKTSFEEVGGQFSPDGRWVAYWSNASGRNEVYVRPFTDSASALSSTGQAEGQWQISTAGGISPRWRPDGKELYYLGPDGQLMAVSITTRGATLEPGAPVALFRTRVWGGGVDSSQGAEYDVARDGRFLINTVLDEDSAPITLIQNWQPEAKK